jgi:hypothetical protein
VRRRSMKRCSPARACRWPSSREHASSRPRPTARECCAVEPAASASTPCSPESSAWSPKHRAAWWALGGVFSMRAGQCRGGAGDCLSLRPRAGHADGDHGRHRTGCHGGYPDQKCRSAGTCRENQRAGRRQDRHTDAWRAGAHRSAAARWCRRTKHWPWQPLSNRVPNIPWPRPSCSMRKPAS